MGPPNVLGFPKPASSISTTNTFGAPSGGSTWPISSHPGVEPASVFAVTPVNGGRRMGSLVRSIVSPLTGRSFSSCRRVPRSCRRRDGAHGARTADEAIGKLGREGAGLLGEVPLEVGRGDLHAEVALAIFSLAEVAEE